MKHRSPPEQHHGKKPRVPEASSSFARENTMEDKAPSNPRELTQNPLKKIWMPCKNGLPEKHISQRKGAYDNVAAFASMVPNRRRINRETGNHPHVKTMLIRSYMRTMQCSPMC